VAAAEYQVRSLDGYQGRYRATDDFSVSEQLSISSVQKRTP
jgi:hypothetical protein